MSAALEQSPDRSQGAAHDWRAPALWAALAPVAAVIAVYHETFATMVAIWARSDTFMHGFLIAPASCALLWARRSELSALRPQPCPGALVLVAASGLLWLLATLGDVPVARQYAAVAMIPASLWAVLGTRMVARMAFPLAFLLLAVPCGEAFIPSLIDLTAGLTVRALQLTGVPVFREGNSFTIPSGTWSVVEACSGLRYLIASITLGSLYAHLAYRSRTRKAVFIALSAAVPVAANSVRAYLIVMLGHLSGMKLAVGVDHLIYGWLFFGMVMLLLFWAGTLWSDERRGPAAAPTPEAGSPAHPAKSIVAAALASIVVVLAWPAWARHMLAAPGAAHGATVALPQRIGEWRRDTAPFPWKPAYAGAPSITEGTYRDGQREVSVHLARYPAQRPGADLASHGNVFAGAGESRWRGMQERTRAVDAAGTAFTLKQATLFGADATFLVWRWYAMDGTTSASPYAVKLRLALDRLLGRTTAGAEILLAARFQEKEEAAEAVLRDFLRNMPPAMREGVDDARGN